LKKKLTKSPNFFSTFKLFKPKEGVFMSKRTRKGEEIIPRKDKEEEEEQSPYAEDIVLLNFKDNKKRCVGCKQQAHTSLQDEPYCASCLLAVETPCYVSCDRCGKHIGIRLVNGTPSNQYLVCGECANEIVDHAERMPLHKAREVVEVIDY
jgi:hypothetical protein